MPTVLFWNVQRKPLDGLVVALAAEHRPDLLVLVEYPPGPLLPRLLGTAGYTRHVGRPRFGVFGRAGLTLTPAPGGGGSDRADFWRATPAVGDDWLVVALHGLDRRNAPHDSAREYLFREVLRGVREAEGRAGHRRSVVLGDLNANPFEPSVVGAGGLHAIGTKLVRGETDRGVRGAGRADLFYNPMWRLYGGDPAGDAGAATYYHRGGYDPIEPFWHMLDQVVIRPEFADRLPPDRLRILTAAGPFPLLDAAGRPDARVGSDHLPVTFTLT